MQPLKTSARPSSESTIGCCDAALRSRMLSRRWPSAMLPWAKKPPESGPRACIALAIASFAQRPEWPRNRISPQSPHIILTDPRVRSILSDVLSRSHPLGLSTYRLPISGLNRRRTSKQRRHFTKCCLRRQSDALTRQLVPGLSNNNLTENFGSRGSWSMIIRNAVISECVPRDDRCEIVRFFVVSARSLNERRR